MNKNTIIGAFIGLVIGVGATVGVATLVNSQSDSATIIDTTSMTMAEMNTDLKGKTGDDFDKAFIEMMIEHHQGAIDMAELIPSRANHDEIKILGEAIITAQTKEIADMKQWQMDWGYMTSNDSMPGMNH